MSVKPKMRLTRVLMLMTSVLVMTGLVGITLYAVNRVNRIVLDNTREDLLAAVEQANQSITYLCENMQSQAKSLAVNQSFVEALLLTRNGGTAYERQQNEVLVERMLQSMYKSAPGLENLVLYTEYQVYYASRKHVEYYRNTLPQTPWLDTVMSGQADNASVCDSYPSSAAGELQSRQLFYAQRLYNSANGNYIGTLVVAMPLRTFTDIVDGMFWGDSGAGMLFDAQGSVVYGANPATFAGAQTVASGTGDAEGGQAAGARLARADYYAFYPQRHSKMLYAAAFVSWETLSADAHSIRRELIVVSAAVCLVIVLALGSVARYLTKPLVDMCHEMDRVSTGKLDIAMKDQPYRETSALVEHFNNMVRKIECLLQQVQQTEREKQQAEMEVLEAQVNPHFVYNTLEAIKWVAIAQKSPNIPQIITALVKLLTMSISVKKKTVTVREELDYLRQYLLLMEFRFNNNYDVVYEVEDGVLDAVTVKMVLQPLVENSIFHGFSNKSGSLRICARAEGETLVLCVQDSGCGFEQGAAQTGQRRSFTGIGTANINKRVQMQYGAAYGLELISATGKGTEVLVRQPLCFETGAAPGQEGETT